MANKDLDTYQKKLLKEIKISVIGILIIVCLMFLALILI